MIVLTGAAGFIGSCLLSKLNNEGYKDIILVDDFSHNSKEANYNNKIFSQQINLGMWVQKKRCLLEILDNFPVLCFLLQRWILAVE